MTYAEAVAAYRAAEEEEERCREVLATAQKAAQAALRAVRAARAARDEALAREAKNRLARARSQAKRTAERLGLTIEREDMGSGPAYWVHAPEGRYPNEEDDPCCGEHFCVGWEEVLDKVNTYAEAMAKEEGTK